MEALQCADDAHADDRDERVIHPRVFEVHAEPVRARDATEAALAAGERAPAKRDRERQRSERERQQ